VRERIEEDHPEAESLCSPLRRHLFCGIRCL
jgi:hypothetical protein